MAIGKGTWVRVKAKKPHQVVILKVQYVTSKKLGGTGFKRITPNNRFTVCDVMGIDPNQVKELIGYNEIEHKVKGDFVLDIHRNEIEQVKHHECMCYNKDLAIAVLQTISGVYIPTENCLFICPPPKEEDFQ